MASPNPKIFSGPPAGRFHYLDLPPGNPPPAAGGFLGRGADTPGFQGLARRPAAQRKGRP